MARSRPAQGNNSKPNKPPRAAYQSDPAPKVVSRGSVSRPKALPSWRPGTLAQDATPKSVQR